MENRESEGVSKNELACVTQQQTLRPCVGSSVMVGAAVGAGLGTAVGAGDIVGAGLVVGAADGPTPTHLRA